jgi:hypothetical protein
VSKIAESDIRERVGRVVSNAASIPLEESRRLAERQG